MTTFGLLIFDGAEELDFVGPWEVFTASAMIQAEAGAAADRCVTVAERGGLVRCAKGLRVVADHSFAGHPPLDVLVVPGGVGLAGTGPASGRPVSPHPPYQEDLAARGGVPVGRDARYVVDGNLVTS